MSDALFTINPGFCAVYADYFTEIKDTR